MDYAWARIKELSRIILDVGQEQVVLDLSWSQRRPKHNTALLPAWWFPTAKSVQPARQKGGGDDAAITKAFLIDCIVEAAQEVVEVELEALLLISLPATSLPPLQSSRCTLRKARTDQRARPYYLRVLYIGIIWFGVL